jgi:hypothetical protein
VLLIPGSNIEEEIMNVEESIEDLGKTRIASSAVFEVVEHMVAEQATQRGRSTLV